MRQNCFVLLSVAVCLAIGCGNPKVPQNTVVDDCGVITRMDTTQNKVYLVFTAHFSSADDGAFENFDGIVPVLDVLKKHGVKGSFFPTGECFRVQRYQEPLRRIISEGHYLSAHSNKHLLLCPEDDKSVNLVTADSLAADIAGMEAELNKLGLKKKDYCWLIPPYENYNQFSAGVLRDLGYKLINPTPGGILTGDDWAAIGADNFVSGEEIMDSIWDFEEDHTMNGVILLIHAMHYPGRTDADRTYTRLDEIITGLKARGYTFGSFKEYI